MKWQQIHYLVDVHNQDLVSVWLTLWPLRQFDLDSMLHPKTKKNVERRKAEVLKTFPSFVSNHISSSE